MKTICPKCSQEIEINVGKLIRQRMTKRRAEASRQNGKKGGRPKKIIPQSNPDLPKS